MPPLIQALAGPLAFLMLAVTSAHPSLAPFNPQAGQLLESEFLRSQTQKSLDLSKRLISPDGFPRSTHSVELWKIRYQTTALDGSLTVASGLVVIPKRPGPRDRGPKGPGISHSLLSYHHGTTLLREDVPSRAATSMDALAASLVFGSMGMVVAAADYLGLGDSPGPHPYLHASSEATVTADMLSATRELCRSLGVALNSNLFLAGYSQGGHVSLALHRLLEERSTSVTATAAMGGAYDLSDTSLREAFLRPSSFSTLYAAYLFFSMHQAHPEALPLEEALRPPYATLLPSLLDGRHSGVEVAARLPLDPKELFTEAFVSAVFESPKHLFRKLLAENNVHDWRPRAPVLFVHARGDEQVPFANAEIAFHRMRSLGADVTLLDVGNLDHMTGAVPAFLTAYRWFQLLH